MTQKSAHRAKMIERRKRQCARTAGFTPVRNARVDNAIRLQFTLMQMQEIERRADPAYNGIKCSDSELQQNAVNAVARKLPAEARRHNSCPVIKPSKNYSTYRKAA